MGKKRQGRQRKEGACLNLNQKYVTIGSERRKNGIEKEQKKKKLKLTLQNGTKFNNKQKMQKKTWYGINMISKHKHTHKHTYSFFTRVERAGRHDGARSGRGGRVEFAYRG